MNSYEHGYNVALALWVFGDYERLIASGNALKRRFGLRAEALTVPCHGRYVTGRDPSTGEHLV